MDIRTTIINNVKCQLSGDFSPEQLQSLSNVLYMQLNEYEVQERCTELAVVDNTADKLLQIFRDTKRLEGKSEKTIDRYADVCYKMIHAIPKPIEEINTFDLRCYLSRYQESRGVSNRTLDGMRRCLRSFFSFLFAENFIPTNPAAALAQIKYDKVIQKPYSPVDVELIKRACSNPRDIALVEFLYATGCRVSEAVALNRDDIDFVNKTAVVFGKGSKERFVFLDEVTLMYIQKYLETRTDDNPCLFARLTKPYNRLSKNGIEYLLRKLGQAANVDKVHPHRYRRTLATDMIRRGAPIQDVAFIL